MLSLFLACAALLLGPLLYQLVFRNPRGLKVVDGFVCVTIGGLLLIHFVEDFDFQSGWIACMFLMAGLLGPLLLERAFSSIEREVHTATLIFGALGFLVHTALDGAALAPQDEVGINLSLAIAVIVHRFPVGLTVWWLLKPRFGSLIAFSGLFLTIAGTVGGYLVASSDPLNSLNFTFPWIQAFVAGSILHVVFFRFHLHHNEPSHNHYEHHHSSEFQTNSARSWICPEGIGNLLGIGFLVLLYLILGGEHGEVHHHHHLGAEHAQLGFFDALLYLAAESAPALAFAYFAGIFIYGFFPESSLQWMKRGNRFIQSGKGMVVGLPLPICSCGVLPYYQTLVKKGAPPASAVAFLIATPELGLDAVFLSFPLLGFELTVVRLAASAVIAFSVAWIVSRQMEQRKTLPVVSDEKSLSFQGKISKGANFALIELVDTTAPWMLLGLVLAAFAEPLLTAVNLNLSGMTEVLLFSALGLVVYVCASGATPLVAALLAAGVSPGAGLAFLLTGPATNISTFGVFSELHGRRTAILFASLMILSAVLAGIVTNLLLPDYQSLLAGGAELHHMSEVGLLKGTSLLLVSGLFLSSFIRQGGRQFFGHVLGDQLAHGH